MKRYERYKPSGVKWIGEIPEHWELKKIKYLASLTLGKMLTSEDKGGYFLKPYLRAQNINWLRVDVSDLKEMWFSENELQKYRVSLNDILVSEGGEVGRTCIWQNEAEECYIQNSVHKVTFKNNHDPRYFLYHFYCSGQSGYFASIVNQISIGHLTGEKLKDVTMLLPDFDEQTAIAAYLDRKTAEINDLIAKKQRLIDVLNEEKTALINHAVTKGLNPDAPMKDTGIPWMGQIPAKWELKRLRFLGDIKYGLGTPPKLKTNGLRLIRATDIQRGEIVDHEMVFVDPENVPYDRDPLLKEHDIIVVRSGAYTGDSAIIPLGHKGSVVGYDLVVRVTRANALFVSYCLLSHYVLTFQIFPNRLRAAQPHLNREELGETLILVPGDGEQADIVGFIQAKTAYIKDTIARVQREIDLLQEYRTALISEVVTGKIDVSGAA